MFATIGMDAFAERARRELAATGETVRKRTDEAWGELTAQEEQIARLARDGLSNPEIGARLYISARTVEWHLRKVFSKLGISSRKGLHDVLPTARWAAAPLAARAIGTRRRPTHAGRKRLRNVRHAEGHGTADRGRTALDEDFARRPPT